MIFICQKYFNMFTKSGIYITRICNIFNININSLMNLLQCHHRLLEVHETSVAKPWASLLLEPLWLRLLFWQLFQSEYTWLHIHGIYNANQPVRHWQPKVKITEITLSLAWIFDVKIHWSSWPADNMTGYLDRFMNDWVSRLSQWCGRWMYIAFHFIYITSKDQLNSLTIQMSL